MIWMHEKGGLIREKERRDPPATMESTDVLNQIHRSNNEVILGCSSSRGEEEYLERISLPASRRDGSAAFRILAGKVRTVVARGFEKHQFPGSCRQLLATFAFPISCLCASFWSRLQERARKRQRKRKRERRQERFIELGNGAHARDK